MAALAADGWRGVAIAAQLGIDHRTVRRRGRAGAFPERASPGTRASILAPYDAHLRARWAAEQAAEDSTGVTAAPVSAAPFRGTSVCL